MDLLHGSSYDEQNGWVFGWNGQFINAKHCLAGKHLRKILEDRLEKNTIFWIT